MIAMLTMCAVAMAQIPAVDGDVNGDGFVTTSDVTALYNYLLNGDATYFATSDVDGDGYITVGDITYVYNIISILNIFKVISAFNTR